MQRLINYFLQVILRIFFKPILKEEKDPYVKKVIELYKKSSFTYFFAKIRIWDSPFQQVERLIPKKGLILDLGCGDGFFSNYLAIKSPQRKIVGIELNSNRIKDANKKIKNAKFVQDNVLSTKFEKSNVILMFHLLHHLPTRVEQEKLIEKCHLSLEKNGKMVIVEVDKKPLSKFLFSHLADKVIVPILFENKLIDYNINYRGSSEWIKLLKKHKMKVRFIRADKEKPFSHIILECYKT